MGVMCSYAEWTKNLSSMRLGRLKKRHTKEGARALLAMLVRNGLQMTAVEKVLIALGADEEAHVCSGLEDMMTMACEEVFEMVLEGKVPTLWVAAYLKAIEAIAQVYTRRGEWP